MVNAAGDVLYVGKAKQLKNRVTNYTQAAGLTTRILRMVEQVVQVEHTITGSEAEALLLESSLIKKLKPRYNILLKDDKSFPYIVIERDHPYPRITKHRGKQARGNTYIGPFPSAGAVNRTLDILQKAFLLRPCSDHYFKNRSRPCLQYQIKRCSGPCVNFISEADYAASIEQATAFLKGRNHEVQAQFALQMQHCSDTQEYEKAAALRDRIRALAQVQHEQQLNAAGLQDADVVALHFATGQSVIQIVFFRGGLNFGSHTYFPRHTEDATPTEILSAFVGQFYQSHEPPKEILLSHPLPDQDVIEQALKLSCGHNVSLLAPQRGDKRTLIETITHRAQEALIRHLQSKQAEAAQWTALAARFDLNPPLNRIEVYDNSHIMGRHALGAMIVATPDGFLPSAYRRFDMKSDIPTGGDDFAMMHAMFSRRFGRLLKDDPAREKDQWPDLVFIDGGIGQLRAAARALDELGISGVPLVAIAKGPDRNAGRETFHRKDQSPFTLPEGDPLLHYIQRLRDEAHRYAIGSHRIKRSNAIRHSELDDVPGIGTTRKRALLHHFGSKAAIERATLSELENVAGISQTIARTIYDYFHA